MENERRLGAVRPVQRDSPRQRQRLIVSWLYSALGFIRHHGLDYYRARAGGLILVLVLVILLCWKRTQARRMACNLHTVVLAVACLGVCILPLVWPLIYGSPTASSCWMVEPYQMSDPRGFPLIGYPPQAAENDGNFYVLYVLYVLCVVASAAGMFVSARLLADKCASGNRHAPGYHGYTNSLFAYYLAQTVFNVAVALSFVENRCHHHNLDLRRLSNCYDSDEECKTGVPTPTSHFVARTVYMMCSMGGGVVTNVVLELVLLRKARMVEGVGRHAQCVKCSGWLIAVQLVIMALFTGWGFYLIGGMLSVEPSMLGGPAFLDKNGDGVIERSEDPTLILQIVMGVFGSIHAGVSIGLCVVFVKLLLALRRRDRAEALGAAAAPLPGSGDGRLAPTVAPDFQPQRERRTQGEVRRTALVARVTVATLVSVSSTLITYGNFGASLVNWLVMLAIDSIINDLSLMWIAVSSEEDDAKNAQEAEMQSMGMQMRQPGMAMAEPMQTQPGGGVAMAQQMSIPFSFMGETRGPFMGETSTPGKVVV